MTLIAALATSLRKPQLTLSNIRFAPDVAEVGCRRGHETNCRALQPRRLVSGAMLLACLSLAACGAGSSVGEGHATVSERTGANTLVAPAPARPRIVVLGDSLTAGFGVPRDQAFPSLLQQRLAQAHHPFEVVNAGVSGDTTAGGLRRLEWALEGDVRILIVALGGNDGLRGLPVEEMKRNLGEIVRRARARRIAVILTGMEAPPNFGREYTARFREAFRELAREHEVTFLPFLLDGVAGNLALNQADGIHPNAEGVRRVADLLWRTLEPMLPAAGEKTLN